MGNVTSPPSISEASTATASLDPTPTPKTPFSMPQRSLTDFQTVDEAIKEWEEQDKIDAQLALEAGEVPRETKSKKSKAAAAKPVADIDAWAAEQKAKEELGVTENWIGKLLEYRNAHPKPNGLLYKETAVGLRFKCTVAISERPLEPFGGQTFSNKKDARRFAAKKAIDWLISNKHMPSDGSVRFPKPVLSMNKPRDPDVPSFASQVPVLCDQLRIGAPAYKIEKSGEGLSLWSGYAVFEGVSWINGRVGEFENVFGQKKAKEVCAEKVLLFLKDIERQRNAHNPTHTPTLPLQQKESPKSRQGSIPPPSPSSTTAASQVPNLCKHLGFRQPVYVITKAPENVSLYSGYAHFNGDPRIPGKIGKFLNVFSYKQAKEKCAEEVLAVLRAVERKRLEEAGVFSAKMGNEVNGEEEEERKRKRISLDVVEKMVKQKMGEDVDVGEETVATVA